MGPGVWVKGLARRCHLTRNITTGPALFQMTARYELRRILERRLQAYFLKLRDLFPVDADAVLHKAEEQATPRGRENDWHRIPPR
jgi:hypothetical protein